MSWIEFPEHNKLSDRDPNGWIGVNERDPEMHQRVLVSTTDYDGNPTVSICTFNHGKRYLAFGGHRDKDVTHWMPLPEPPK